MCQLWSDTESLAEVKLIPWARRAALIAKMLAQDQSLEHRVMAREGYGILAIARKLGVPFSTAMVWLSVNLLFFKGVSDSWRPLNPTV